MELAFCILDFFQLFKQSNWPWTAREVLLTNRQSEGLVWARGLGSLARTPPHGQGAQPRRWIG